MRGQIGRLGQQGGEGEGQVYKKRVSDGGDKSGKGSEGKGQADKEVSRLI